MGTGVGGAALANIATQPKRPQGYSMIDDLRGGKHEEEGDIQIKSGSK